MKSAVAVTYELDDVALAVEDLASQLEPFILLKNSAGILFCDSTVDCHSLLKKLQSQFPFDIAGCTAAGMLHGDVGFHEACIILTVITGDDCDFQVALSDPITPENAEAVIARTYQDSVSALCGDPKLIIMYPSYRLDVVVDVYSETLGKVSGGVPVFGALPSRNAEFGENAVLAKGNAYQDRLVMLIVGGNVRPVFTVKNVLSNLVLKKRTITKARDNIIYKVGNHSFVDFLRSLGLSVKKYHLEDNTFTYFTNPLLIEPPENELSDGEPIVRTLFSLSPEDGTGTIIGRVQEGSTISVGTMSRQDIRISTQEGIDELNKKIAENQQDGYRYSLILAASCLSRFMIIAPDNDMEGKVLTASIQNPLALSGFYANAEMCPTSVHHGIAVNRTHNQSIVLCAL